MSTVRVLPNVTGLDQVFDYAVPQTVSVHVGDLVRVSLNGRRIGGWVVDTDPINAYAGALADVSKVSSRGPRRELIELAAWAARRWAGKQRDFLVSASPQRNVLALPAERRSLKISGQRSPAAAQIVADGGGVLQLPPTSDPLPALLSAVQNGPILVVVPSVDAARILGRRLRGCGATVAIMPDEWAAAAGGVDVVIGGPSTAWAPCPGLKCGVVLDEHDDVLQREGAPTWHARDVMIERCRRAGAACVLVSPCPTLTAVEWATPIRPPIERQRRAWPDVLLVDRSEVPPWQRSLVTSELIAELVDHDRTVVCVSNTTGRGRVLACRSCKALARCERCDAALLLDDVTVSDSQPDGGTPIADTPHSGGHRRLMCPRCALERPPTCAHCGAGRFANLRPGVKQLVDDLAAAARREVVMVTGEGPELVRSAGVYVGTEAVLHRVAHADTVAFLEIDRELFAPRYRASEQAFALIARGARLVGTRAQGGRVLIQTFAPDHSVCVAAARCAPESLVESERQRRSMLKFPPFGACAEIVGAGADAFVASIDWPSDVVAAGAGDRYLVRADGWDALGAALSGGVRPAGSRLRVAIDPPRI